MFSLRPGHTRRARAIAAGGALFVLALAAACGGGDGSSSADDETPDIVVSFPSPSGDVTPRPRKTPISTSSPTATPLKVCAPNPDPAQASILQTLSPAPGQQVKVPFYVSGWGSNIGFESRGVAVALVNAKQEVVQVLDVPPQPRTFRIAPAGMEITPFTQPFGADVVVDNIHEPTPFCIWVYQETDEEGTPKGVVQIPIVVVP